MPRGYYLRLNLRAATEVDKYATTLEQGLCYSTFDEPQVATQTRSVATRWQSLSSRPFPCPCYRVTLAATLFAVALLVSGRPRPSCFQWVTILLTFQPGFESRFINGQIENLWLAEQLPERLHYLCCGGEDNLVHGFRFALTGVGIEIDPASIGTEHEHPFLWHRIFWRHARLSDQIRTAFATRAKVQDVSISIVISNRVHSIVLITSSLLLNLPGHFSRKISIILPARRFPRNHRRGPGTGSPVREDARHGFAYIGLSRRDFPRQDARR